jgi:hypothetical protein
LYGAEDVAVRALYLSYLDSYFKPIRFEDLLRIGLCCSKEAISQYSEDDHARSLINALSSSYRLDEQAEQEWTCVRTFHPLTQYSESFFTQQLNDYYHQINNNIEHNKLLLPNITPSNDKKLSETNPLNLSNTDNNNTDSSFEIPPIPLNSTPLDFPLFRDDPLINLQLGQSINHNIIKKILHTNKAEPEASAGKIKRKAYNLMAFMRSRDLCTVANLQATLQATRNSSAENEYDMQLIDCSPVRALAEKEIEQVVEQQLDKLPPQKQLSDLDIYGEEIVVAESNEIKSTGKLLKGKKQQSRNNEAAQLREVVNQMIATANTNINYPGELAAVDYEYGHTNQQLVEEIINLQLQLQQQIVENNAYRSSISSKVKLSELSAFNSLYSRWSGGVENIYRYSNIWSNLRCCMTTGLADVSLPPALLNYHKAKYGYDLSHNLLNLSQYELESSLEVEMESRDNYSVCCVCFSSDSDELINPIVYCEECNLTVHQRCYGIKLLPEGDWFCDYCAVDRSNKLTIQDKSNKKNKAKQGIITIRRDKIEAICVLCSIRGGALKQLLAEEVLEGSSSKVQFIHIVCALWTPGLRINDLLSMSPISNMKQIISAQSKELGSSALCFICKEACGVSVKCSTQDCSLYFHVLCGWYYGLFYSLLSEDIQCKLSCYCPAHTPSNILINSNLAQYNYAASSGQLAEFWSFRNKIRQLQQRELRNRGRAEQSNNKRKKNKTLLAKQLEYKEDQYEVGRCCCCFLTDDEIHQHKKFNEEIHANIYKHETQPIEHVQLKLNQSINQLHTETGKLINSLKPEGCKSVISSAPAADNSNILVDYDTSLQFRPSTLFATSSSSTTAHSNNINIMLRCDECGIHVHSSCYGVEVSSVSHIIKAREARQNALRSGNDLNQDNSIDISNEVWLCRRCVEGLVDVSCVLCPRKGGAFTHTTQPGEWIHTQCGRWFPEVQWKDNLHWDYAYGYEAIPPSIRKLRCYLCQRLGPCVDCSESCNNSFHPLCGYFSGQFMLIYSHTNDIESHTAIAHCRKHTPIHLTKNINIPSNYSKLWNIKRQTDQIKELMERERKLLNQQLILLNASMDKQNEDMRKIKQLSLSEVSEEKEAASEERSRKNQQSSSKQRNKQQFPSPYIAHPRDTRSSARAVSPTPPISSSPKKSLSVDKEEKPSSLTEEAALERVIQAYISQYHSSSSPSLEFSYVELADAFQLELPNSCQRDIEIYLHKEAIVNLLAVEGLQLSKEKRLEEYNGVKRNRRYFTLQAKDQQTNTKKRKGQRITEQAAEDEQQGEEKQPVSKTRKSSSMRSTSNSNYMIPKNSSGATSAVPEPRDSNDAAVYQVILNYLHEYEVSNLPVEFSSVGLEAAIRHYSKGFQCKDIQLYLNKSFVAELLKERNMEIERHNKLTNDNNVQRLRRVWTIKAVNLSYNSMKKQRSKNSANASTPSTPINPSPYIWPEVNESLKPRSRRSSTNNNNNNNNNDDNNNINLSSSAAVAKSPYPSKSRSFQTPLKH